MLIAWGSHTKCRSAAVAVWIVYELASRPSYIPAIREELARIAEPTADGSHQLTYESLRQATHLDSFIREVLRLKGDTLVICRQTVQDTPMAGYVIPKGWSCILSIGSKTRS